MMIPILGWIAYYIGFSILLFGVTLFFLNIARDKEANYDDLIKGHKN